jgi:hypothetical protein
MKFSEMIDERTSLNEVEMKFNEMKCKRTSPNVREMSQMKWNKWKFEKFDRDPAPTKKFIEGYVRGRVYQDILQR